jgi:hypothetical protein
VDRADQPKLNMRSHHGQMTGPTRATQHSGDTSPARGAPAVHLRRTRTVQVVRRG